MFKSVKKGVGAAAKKAVDYVGEKVKTETEEKAKAYRKRIILALWVQTFFIFGIVLLTIGLIHFFSRTYPRDLVYILSGIIMLLIGYFTKRRDD